MIRNSILIALFMMNCAYQICMVSGENCTASDQPPYSNACIFNCIENLYNKTYCNACPLRLNPIKWIENDTLSSLILYKYVRFDEGNKSIASLPSCSGCIMNETLVHTFVEYVRPDDLDEFHYLIDHLTEQSNHTKVNHTIVQIVHELYTNITNHFDESKEWCVNALGIAEHYNRFRMFVEANAVVVSMINSSTPSIVPLSNSSIDSDTTTLVPFTSNVQTPEPNNKNGTKEKTKPQLHDHHFHHSVTIITVISLILLAILIISVVIIGRYLKQKHAGAHLTGSRTYVFDHQK